MAEPSSQWDALRPAPGDDVYELQRKRKLLLGVLEVKRHRVAALEAKQRRDARLGPGKTSTSAKSDSPRGGDASVRPSPWRKRGQRDAGLGSQGAAAPPAAAELPTRYAQHLLLETEPQLPSGAEGYSCAQEKRSRAGEGEENGGKLLAAPVALGALGGRRGLVTGSDDDNDDEDVVADTQPEVDYDRLHALLSMPPPPNVPAAGSQQGSARAGVAKGPLAKPCPPIRETMSPSARAVGGMGAPPAPATTARRPSLDSTTSLGSRRASLDSTAVRRPAGTLPAASGSSPSAAAPPGRGRRLSGGSRMGTPGELMLRALNDTEAIEEQLAADFARVAAGLRDGETVDEDSIEDSGGRGGSEGPSLLLAPRGGAGVAAGWGPTVPPAPATVLEQVDSRYEVVCSAPVLDMAGPSPAAAPEHPARGGEDAAGPSESQTGAPGPTPGGAGDGGEEAAGAAGGWVPLEGAATRAGAAGAGKDPDRVPMTPEEAGDCCGECDGGGCLPGAGGRGQAAAGAGAGAGAAMPPPPCRETFGPDTEETRCSTQSEGDGDTGAGGSAMESPTEAQTSPWRQPARPASPLGADPLSSLPGAEGGEGADGQAASPPPPGLAPPPLEQPRCASPHEEAVPETPMPPPARPDEEASPMPPAARPPDPPPLVPDELHRVRPVAEVQHVGGVEAAAVGGPASRTVAAFACYRKGDPGALDVFVWSLAGELLGTAALPPPASPGGAAAAGARRRPQLLQFDPSGTRLLAAAGDGGGGARVFGVPRRGGGGPLEDLGCLPPGGGAAESLLVAADTCLLAGAAAGEAWGWTLAEGPGGEGGWDPATAVAWPLPQMAREDGRPVGAVVELAAVPGRPGTAIGRAECGTVAVWDLRRRLVLAVTDSEDYVVRSLCPIDPGLAPPGEGQGVGEGGEDGWTVCGGVACLTLVSPPGGGEGPGAQCRVARVGPGKRISITRTVARPGGGTSGGYAALAAQGACGVGARVDGGLVLWDVASGQVRGEVVALHGCPAMHIALHPGCRAVVAGGGDGRALLCSYQESTPAPG